MKISIIIPTRNRARYLEKMLDSLLNQTISKEEFEVIVVDNGSTDVTRAVCFDKKKYFPHFKYVYEKSKGLHAGRNRGFWESKSEYLLFADDDIIGFPTWIEGIMEGFGYENVGLVGGNVIPKFETTEPEWFQEFVVYKNGFRIMSQLSVIWTSSQENKIINPYYVFGCNFGVKRELLEKCGGFHPDGMPNNLLMYRGDGESYVSQYIRENGGRAIFVPKASVYHIMPYERTLLSYLIKRGKCDGISEMYSKLRKESINGGIQCLEQAIKVVRDVKGYKKIYYRAVMKGKAYLFFYYSIYPQIREWISKDNYL
ncbi:MAG: glycosyltransferase family 2 protein [Lachnospiraceae bacterium]|nr:glycosyltransferase family 2 protein [Lachnospiraceae bacterium]